MSKDTYSAPDKVTIKPLTQKIHFNVTYTLDEVSVVNTVTNNWYPFDFFVAHGTVATPVF